MKRILIFTFTFLLLFSTRAMAKEQDGLNKYERYYGRVEEVTQAEKNSQILVKNESFKDKGFEKLFLYTGKVPVIDLKTGEFVENYEFKNGEMIQYFFREDTPVLQSFPAKLSPDFIAINVEEAKYSLDVDFFDEDGNGISNRLKINVNSDTVAENLRGEKEEDVLNKDLAVLYTVATRSNPPITNPDKIIVLDKRIGIVKLMDYKAEGEKGFYLRKYYEALGAKVTWNQETSSTRISINDKFVDIKNKESLLVIKDKDTKMEKFFVEDGVSYISEKDIEKINDYLLK